MSYSDHRSRDYDRERRHHSPVSNNQIVYDERDKYAGDYVSICLKNLTDTLTDNELSDAIYREFRKFGNFNVKVVYDRNMTHDRRAERIAFVNFDSHQQAREAKRIKLNITFHGLPLYIEPVFRNRSNAQLPPPPPPPSSSQHYSSDSNYHHRASRITTPPLPPHKTSSISSSSRRRSSSRTKHSSRSLRRTSTNSSSPESRRRRRNDHHQLESIKSSSRHRTSRSRSRHSPLPHHKTSPITQRNSRHHHHHPHDEQRYIYTSPSSHRHQQQQHQQQHNYHNRYPQQPHHHHHHHHHEGGGGSYIDHSYKPELNDKDVTRTLFIGNLDPDVDEIELRKLFDRFGYIEDIDIKRIPNKKPYAFIKYINLDMAHNAKMEMNDKLIGKFEIKIGFGKVQPTNCLWIGGLCTRVKKTSLEKYFSNYGKIREIDWNPGDQYAYILFNSVVDAEDARNHLNEKPLPDGSTEKLRIDYGDPKRFESTLDDNNSVTGGGRSRSRSLTISNSFQSRSRSVSKTSLSPPQHQSSKRYYNNSSGGGNGHRYSCSSNDEKSGFKRQKLNTPLSRKIKTPPIDDRRSPAIVKQQHRSSNRSSNHHHHHHHHNQHRNDDNHNSDVELKIDNSSEIDLSQKEEEITTTTTPNSDLLIKDILINKDSQLNRIINIDDINKNMKHIWFGAFTLKKIAFPTKFYCLAGNKHLAEELLPTTSSQKILRITQRLRLDPSKVEELEKKLYDSNFANLQNSDNCQFSVLIALPNELEKHLIINKNDELSTTVGSGGGDVDDVSTTTLQQRSLHNLIIYLNQKTAAGVIPLPDDDRPIAMVHAFPPNCQFSIKLLKQLLPNVKITDLLMTQTNGQINNDYLIVVLLKN